MLWIYLVGCFVCMLGFSFAAAHMDEEWPQKWPHARHCLIGAAAGWLWPLTVAWLVVMGMVRFLTTVMDHAEK
jgi:hypothetical protein